MARRISPYQAVALAHLFSLACLAAAIALLHLPTASHGTMVIGLIAGLFGGGGLILFYRALSLGEMGLTAAIAGVLSAAVPVVCSLLTEGLPKIHQLLGFAVAIVAIWMIAAASHAAPSNHRSLWMGSVAGACFGIYFVLLKLAVSSVDPAHATPSALASVFWSILFSRVSSATLASLLSLWMVMRAPRTQPRGRSLWHRQTLLLAAPIGLLDMGGNLLYTLAARLGRMDVAAVLSSLYPAVTILLAVWILKERTSRTQSFGMGLALVAVGLISI